MQPDGSEVTHVARRQATDSEGLGQRDHRSVDEPEAQIRETSVHLHCTCQLTRGRRRVGEGASREILPEQSHRATLTTEEVVELGQNEARDVTGAGLLDRPATGLWSAAPSTR